MLSVMSLVLTLQMSSEMPHLNIDESEAVICTKDRLDMSLMSRAALFSRNAPNDTYFELCIIRDD